MDVEETLRLISNPYAESKLSIIHSSSGYNGFEKFYNNFLIHCSNLSLIEILIKVDSYKDVELYEKILGQENIKYKILVYPVYNLRHSMHIFFNDLASISSSDLIWPVGEDVKIKRGNWLDAILDFNNILNKKYKDGIYSIGISQETDRGEYVRIGKMQIVTKKWVDALGEFCPFPNIDRWLYYMSEGIGRMDVIDKNKLLLYYPSGRRTFSKKDKKYIFNPAIKKAIKEMKKKINKKG